MPVAEALATRARDDGRIAALLHNNIGVIYKRNADASERYTQALTLMEASYCWPAPSRSTRPPIRVR